MACVAGSFSDAMWYPYFLAPFIFAIAITSALPKWTMAGRKPFAFAGAPGSSKIGSFLVRITFASLIGSLLQLSLYRQSLPGAELHLSDFLPSSAAAIAAATTWSMICFIVLAGVAAYAFCTATFSVLRERQIGFAPAFLTLAGAASCLGSMAVMLALHTDVDSYRYALPLLWWPFIFDVALGRWTATLTGWIAALGAIAIAATFVPLKLPTLISWHSPLERCLHANANQFGLRAGLATYWYSRPVMASSNWTLQVNQVARDGSIYIWGNNAAAYRHDLHDSGRVPFYNFVVHNGMDREKVIARWGQPTDSFVCRHLQIWTYDRVISPSTVS